MLWDIIVIILEKSHCTVHDGTYGTYVWDRTYGLSGIFKTIQYAPLKMANGA